MAINAITVRTGKALYGHPQDAVKLQAANLMQDLLNSQNPCYVAFMKNKNRKAKKAG